MKRTRRTRITQQDINKIRAAVRRFNATTATKSKKIIIPGPYTNLETPLQVKVQLRPSKSIDDQAILGTYPNVKTWDERGWYPIFFNLITQDITQVVKQHGLDAFLAACERDLNTKDNQKLYGKVVILKVVSDHSLTEQRPVEDRFVSCYAKTTKRSIVGFWLARRGQSVIIGKLNSGDNLVGEDQGINQ